MRLDGHFQMGYGNSLALNQLTQVEEGEGIAFVSRTAQNNGISAWVEPLPELEPFEPGLLTVSLRSRNHALATFLQTRPFYTAYHVFVLKPKQPMTDSEKLWWAACIERNRYRYNYGRQANRSLAALIVPDAAPPWTKDVVAIDPIDADVVVSQPPPQLDTQHWMRIEISDLFIVHRGGGGIIKRDVANGTTPLVSASEKNNGISKRVDAEPRFPAGWITVCSNGSVGEAFVQPEPFLATADVTVLQPPESMSLRARFFICTLIRREKYRFNYGRKWPAGRLASSTIEIPATAGAEPDFAGMEQFINCLPFSRFVFSNS